MFAPQVALAILASAFGPLLARRLGLRGVLLLGLAGDVASMAMLSASPLLIGSPTAFALLCAATGALGLGFGATVMALNTLIEGLFPKQANSAVLALNALLGLGTALAPVLIAAFTALGVWWELPLVMAAVIAALLATFAVMKGPLGADHRTGSASGALPARFWLYAAAMLLYGVVETLCGNWGTVYLSSERHLPARDASFALTAFWLMATLGRVAFAVLDRWLPAKWVYVALPLTLAVVFQGVALADGPISGVGAFAAAGLACSALLPLTISLAGSEFPSHAAVMSGELIAIYQAGYGVAAFGVGPLRDIAGVSYATAFSLGGAVAIILAAVAALLVRSPKPS
jgi:FHS family glucose/mannose:H+ symporter-like MFS transporter